MTPESKSSGKESRLDEEFCKEHGNFRATCSRCGELSVPESLLTPERLAKLSSLETEVHGDFAPLLGEINKRLNLHLTPRPEGFHMTIIGPTEYKVIKTLTPDKLAQLEELNRELQDGEGIEVRGIGFVDGGVMNVREADKTKRTAFLAVDAPKMQEFRAEIGLAPKFFHVTLGFEVGDLHMRIVGTDEKGKPKLAPIEKVADPRFDDFRPLIENSKFSFGSLSGDVKNERQEKPKPKEIQNVSFDVSMLRERLGAITALGFADLERVIEAASGGSKALEPLMKELGVKLKADMRFVREAVKASEKK